MTIVLGNDHAATDYKNDLKKYIESKNINVIDVGTYDKYRTDYFIYGEKAYLAYKELKDVEKVLIVICGSGVGISQSANKAGAECVLINSVAGLRKSKHEFKSHQYAMGSRTTTFEIAKLIIDNIIDN